MSRRPGGVAVVGRLTGLALVVAATSVLSPPGAAEAGSGLPGFVATATAEGNRVMFTVPDFVAVEEVTDAGGPVAQAALDPQGAESFAALPYPGDLVVTGPGLVAAFTGVSLPVAYPLHASASHPVTPEHTVEDPAGVYRLSASAGARAAAGSARMSAPASEGGAARVGGTRAVAGTSVEGGTITATAETVNEVLSVADGALRIASVRSRSVTTYSVEQARPVTRTGLVVEGGSAAGMTFGYGPEGLTVAGWGVPMPAGDALEQLNAALEPAGVSLRLVGARPLADGGSAEALEIVIRGRLPVAGLPEGIVTLRLGGATSAVSVGEGLPGLLPPTPARDAPVEGVHPPKRSDPPAPDTPPEPLMPAAGGLPDPSAPDPVDTGRSGGQNTIPPVVDGGSTRAPDRGPVAEEVAAEGTRILLRPRDLGADGFVYGTLVAGAALMVVMSLLWRAKGGLPL